MDDLPAQEGRLARIEAINVALKQLRKDCDCDAVLIRFPYEDPYCPHSGDVDVIVIGAYPDLLPQRLQVASTLPLIDLIKLPRNTLRDVDRLALQGVIPHRLLTSTVAYDRHLTMGSVLHELRLSMFASRLQAPRIAAILELGYLAVREVGVTRDVPELALFWIHMAFASLVAAICDAAQILCPNVYTRPFDYFDIVKREVGLSLCDVSTALCLDQDFNQLSRTLENWHQMVTDNYPEPHWPEQMRMCTRYEYRYYAAQPELDWRIQAATELKKTLHAPAAIFYLRFVGYMLACMPIVFHRASEGVDVSYIRPQRAVGPDLQKNAPEVLPFLRAALGARETIDSRALEYAIGWVQELKSAVDRRLIERGIVLTNQLKWVPFERSAAVGA